MDKEGRRIYLSGRVTGTDDFRSRFKKAEADANRIFKEYAVVNPVEQGDNALGKDATWADYMRYDISLLTGCDAILMLSGWRKSKGAKLERHIAKKLGLKVFYEHDFHRQPSMERE